MKLGTKVKTKNGKEIGELVGVVNWKYAFSQQRTLFFANKNFKNDIAIVVFDKPVETYPYSKFKEDYINTRGPSVEEDILRYSHSLQCYSAHQFIPLKELEAV